MIGVLINYSKRWFKDFNPLCTTVRFSAKIFALIFIFCQRWLTFTIYCFSGKCPRVKHFPGRGKSWYFEKTIFTFYWKLDQTHVLEVSNIIFVYSTSVHEWNIRHIDNCKLQIPNVIKHTLSNNSLFNQIWAAENNNPDTESDFQTQHE